MTAVLVRITGKVQGVAFRYQTKEKAVSLSINGWVRNRLDGSVEGFFQGSDELVDQILLWCHRGPVTAKVEHISADYVQVDPLLSGFRVRSTC